MADSRDEDATLQDRDLPLSDRTIRTAFPPHKISECARNRLVNHSARIHNTVQMVDIPSSLRPHPGVMIRSDSLTSTPAKSPMTMSQTTHRCLLGLFFTAFLGCSLCAVDEPFKVLVFTKTEGFHHPSIVDGVRAIKEIGRKNGFEAEDSDDAGMFTADKLKPFAVVVSLSTTGNVFNDEQKQAFVTWFQDHHGWVGIHAAADCEFDWEWYHGLVGAFYKNHPGSQSAKLIVSDRTFPATSKLPAVWTHGDEWFNFRSPPSDVHVVMKLDESSYTGGEMNGDHPIAWWHHYHGGRAFYSQWCLL